MGRSRIGTGRENEIGWSSWSGLSGKRGGLPVLFVMGEIESSRSMGDIVPETIPVEGEGKRRRGGFEGGRVHDKFEN